MTKRLDPDEIGDALAGVGDKLFADTRTVVLALKLDELRRDIVRVLSVEPPAPRRVCPDQFLRRSAPPCEASRQAREQGAGDGLRVCDLEANIAAHGGRFVAVSAQW